MTAFQAYLVLFLLGWIAASLFIITTELIKLNRKFEIEMKKGKKRDDSD